MFAARFIDLLLHSYVTHSCSPVHVQAAAALQLSSCRSATASSNPTARGRRRRRPSCEATARAHCSSAAPGWCGRPSKLEPDSIPSLLFCRRDEGLQPSEAVSHTVAGSNSNQGRGVLPPLLRSGYVGACAAPRDARGLHRPLPLGPHARHCALCATVSPAM
eukprot:1926867-Pleurochrysis_carterae.AAC.6